MNGSPMKLALFFSINSMMVNTDCQLDKIRNHPRQASGYTHERV